MSRPTEEEEEKYGAYMVPKSERWKDYAGKEQRLEKKLDRAGKRWLKVVDKGKQTAVSRAKAEKRIKKYNQVIEKMWKLEDKKTTSRKRAKEIMDRARRKAYKDA